MNMEVENTDFIRYSGVSFRHFGSNGKSFLLKKNNLPSIIYIARLKIANTEFVDLDIEKIMKIFENGKFIGPSIVEEDKFTY